MGGLQGASKAPQLQFGSRIVISSSKAKCLLPPPVLECGLVVHLSIHFFLHLIEMLSRVILPAWKTCFLRCLGVRKRTPLIAFPSPNSSRLWKPLEFVDLIQGSKKW